MHKAVFGIALALALVMGQAAAHADMKVHKAAKVSLDIPEGWKITAANETDMVILEPKEEVLVILRVLEASALDKATKDVDAFIAKSVDKVKWEDKAKPTKLNGMDALALEGTGLYKGTPVDLGVLVVVTPAKKVLLVLGVMDHKSSAQHQAQVDAFVTSIKPAH